jgi:hypothetical protein
MTAYITSTATTNVTTVFTTPLTTMIATGGTGGSTISPSLYLHLINQTKNITSNQFINNILCRDNTFEVKDGEPCTIKLPDGTIIKVESDGSFNIQDKNAKVTYRANRVRDFNTFINASDKLEAFIKFCGQQGIRKEEMLQLPINLFIGWLILEAAKADREPEPSIPLLPNLRKHIRPRCKCGRFISFDSVKKHVAFCGPLCFNKYYKKMGLSSSG